ncbi:HDOD domain-containing protein [Propionivibrio limicola]|uniref:HDOD domain-containing protein n=1 Tax=Propionivibrio limicola TaxID=167645 RepID=UPI00129147D2|nr:HDOD domain-containing protein [Propionivibrio limicola]
MAFDKALLDRLSGNEVKSVKRLIEKGVTIPPQPRVLVELEQNLAKGVSDVRVLARVISQDPGIVAMLFKVVQNAAFRKFQPFESLEHILQAIGLQQTGNLVRAIALASSMPAKHNQKAFEAYWARSRTISELAMIIADERVAVCNIFPDQAGLAGIFHDCGVPVLMQRFQTYCADMRLDQPGHWPDLAEEDARFNADHCVIGYLVARHWRLPDFICDSIRYHHDIGRIEHHAARTMVAILQLAIQMYYHDLHQPYPEWAGVRADVIEELGLGDETLPEFIDVVLDRYHSMNQA